MLSEALLAKGERIREFLAWFIPFLKPWSSVRYDFKIPDPTRPIPLEERRFGPSGELMPFIPAPLDPAIVTGRIVEEVSTSVGTYGMGGMGFFGLRLDAEWLVISIWGSGHWILVDGRLVGDLRHEHYGRPLPWIHKNYDGLTPLLVGTSISSIVVEKQNVAMHFSNGSVLEIDNDPHRRPIFEGNKRPRDFMRQDDLRRAVFLSPTAEIWS